MKTLKCTLRCLSAGGGGLVGHSYLILQSRQLIKEKFDVKKRLLVLDGI